MSFNGNGTDDDIDLAFPIRLASASLEVVGTGVTMMFETWYDLPTLRKEAVVTVTFAFIDNDGRTISKSADFNIAP